ncbi:vesicle-associated membrane protein-associated protein B [Aethina tumida]|uniref:vesicle-associated membrane protein-associated protein B n=1 Tax=Aethina tumida TaxID=116153 RepID=UPI002147D540|nr:vesicle-associated membrane protein-associated protein B [Aethina tumida]
MSKPEQVLVIEPQNELRFRGPFNNAVTSYMKLTNPSEKKVLFKIKTTAPKKYCVRPNSGVLNPNSTIEIAICLQPFVFDPAEKNKHKFMVQTVFAPEGEINLEQLWKEIGSDQLMDSKLKCVFELPAENETHEEPNKASPKLDTTAQSNSEESELKRAAAEIQMLREEESMLRKENLRLQEMVLQLKDMKQTPSPNRYAPPAQQPQKLPLSMEQMAIAIVLGIVGIIIGKFVL